ncbi:DMT family transporter [Rhodovibrionaceae bacterium A322]
MSQSSSSSPLPEQQGTVQADNRQQQLGWFLGFIGVTAFALTLPMTRLALVTFDPWFIGLGRAALAGLVAGAILLITRQPLPKGKDLWLLMQVSLGVVFGFPLFSTWAMQDLPASHGGVVLGILPLATAAGGALLAKERPSLAFWLVSLAGSALVIGYSLSKGGGSLALADLALLAAVIAAALGYTQGAVLTPRLGAWQTICWALVISLPLTLPASFWLWPQQSWQHLTWVSGSAFIYVSLISQLAGFFAWYRGLALGGVAKVGQVQLLQTFITLAVSALLLGEHIGWGETLTALLVLILVAVGKRLPVKKG